jgi:hypothetical protein
MKGWNFIFLILGAIGLIAGIISGLVVIIALGAGFVIFFLVTWQGGIGKVRRARQAAKGIKSGGEQMRAVLSALGEAGHKLETTGQDFDS